MGLFDRFYKNDAQAHEASAIVNSERSTPAIFAIPAISGKHLGDQRPKNSENSENSSYPPADTGDKAVFRSVSHLRLNGVAVTLDEGARRPLVHGEVLDLLPDGTLDQLRDLAPAVVKLLKTEQRDAEEGRRRFVNPVPWRWPADLDDALTEARQRNEDGERRGTTARYCICARLAENEWATSRGRVWICEPCREDRIVGLEILPSKSRRVV